MKGNHRFRGFLTLFKALQKNPSAAMSSTYEEKAVRIVTFDGSKEKWWMLSRKFLAIAMRRGYQDIIL